MSAASDVTPIRQPTANLAAALAKAQAEFPPIAKDRTVNTGTYKFDYATLSEIRTSVTPALSKHGLATSGSLVYRDDGTPGVEVMLLHGPSGETKSSNPLWAPAKPSKIQDLGSLLTYLRRYAECLLLDIVADEDDDGNAAEGNHGRELTARKGPAPKAAEPPPVDRASEIDMKNIYIAVGKFEKDRAKAQDWIETMIGPLPRDADGHRTIRGISKTDAQKLLKEAAKEPA